MKKNHWIGGACIAAVLTIGGLVGSHAASGSGGDPYGCQAMWDTAQQTGMSLPGNPSESDYINSCLQQVKGYDPVTGAPKP